MFRFLQEVEKRLRDAALGGSFKEVMGLLEQGVNVDAADEVRHVIPCHVCFMPTALEGVLWPKRYLQHPLPIYGITTTYMDGVGSDYVLATPSSDKGMGLLNS